MKQFILGAVLGASVLGVATMAVQSGALEPTLEQAQPARSVVTQDQDSRSSKSSGSSGSNRAGARLEYDFQSGREGALALGVPTEPAPAGVRRTPRVVCPVLLQQALEVGLNPVRAYYIKGCLSAYEDYGFGADTNF